MSTHPYFAQGGDSQIVYVRHLDPASLPKKLRREVRGMDAIYAIHDADGQLLAVVDDRDKAFRVARMHERHPVGVH